MTDVVPDPRSAAVGVFVHGGRADAISLGREICGWLLDEGDTVVSPGDEAAALNADGDLGVLPDHPSREIRLVVAVGGDGTMLRATHRAVEAGAEVMGINLGQLGYLAEIEPGGWREALEAYRCGGHRIEERLLVTTELDRRSHGASAFADAPPFGLNEVVIEKQAMGRTVRLGVSIDGTFFTSYVADGLILATPTGSTAYSLSARGPIVDPGHKALVMTPVSPHSLFDRSLVLDPSSVIEVSVLGDRPATVAIDGLQMSLLDPGDVVRIRAADRPARFVSFGHRNFHQILKAKFGLSDR